MTGPDSVATGSLIRPDAVRRYASEAGFSELDLLPVDIVPRLPAPTVTQLEP